MRALRNKRAPISGDVPPLRGLIPSADRRQPQCGVLATFGTYTAIGGAAALISETYARAREQAYLIALDRAFPPTGPEPLEVL